MWLDCRQCMAGTHINAIAIACWEIVNMAIHCQWGLTKH